MQDLNGTEHESYRTMGLAPTGAKHVDNYGNIYYGGSTSVGNVYDDQQKAFWAGLNSSSSSGAGFWPGAYSAPPASSFGATDYGAASPGSSGYSSYSASAISFAGPKPPRRKRVRQPLTRTKIAAIAALAAFGSAIWCWLGPQISDGGAILAACELAAFLMLAFMVKAVPNTLPVKGRWLWRAGICLQWLLPPVAGLCFSALVAAKAVPILAQLIPFLFTGLVAAMPVFLLVSLPLAVAMYRCDPLRHPKA